jgi:hypothetical protein
VSPLVGGLVVWFSVVVTLLIAIADAERSRATDWWSLASVLGGVRPSSRGGEERLPSLLEGRTGKEDPERTRFWGTDGSRVGDGGASGMAIMEGCELYRMAWSDWKVVHEL